MSSDSEEENSQGGPLVQYTQTQISAIVKQNRCSRAVATPRARCS